MAKKAKSSAAASLNPDTFISAGLAADFDGTIVKARFVPWDYNGKIDEPVLGVAITIEPDPDQDVEDEFVQHYSAGDLENFVPSQDGEEPCDLTSDDAEDHEGLYAIKAEGGRKDALNNNTNFAQFLMALVDCGFDTSKMGASLEFLEGIHGHFDRVPQKKRKGIVRDDYDDSGRQRNNDLLVITELKEEKKSSSAKAKAKKAEPEEDENEEEETPKAKKTAAKGGDLDDQLADIVIEMLVEADGKPVKKQDIGKRVLKSKDIDPKLKGKAVKRAGETEFLEGNDAWVYDADEGTVLSAE